VYQALKLPALVAYAYITQPATATGAIKRESLRNKLQRSDEPESRVDQKTLEEQARLAERSAMEVS
jgi:hypothetical protein